MLRRALGQVETWGLVGRDLAQLVERSHLTRKLVAPLTVEHVRAFIEFTKADRLGPLFHVAIATGLCQGELVGLRWKNVDLARGTLSMRHGLQRIDGQPTLVAPKTVLSRRTVILPGSAVTVLKMQRTGNWRSGCSRAPAGRTGAWP